MSAGLASELRALADPRVGLARGFPDAQATLNAAADALDRLSFARELAEAHAAIRELCAMLDDPVAQDFDPGLLSPDLVRRRSGVEVTGMLVPIQHLIGWEPDDDRSPHQEWIDCAGEFASTPTVDHLADWLDMEVGPGGWSLYRVDEDFSWFVEVPAHTHGLLAVTYETIREAMEAGVRNCAPDGWRHA